MTLWLDPHAAGFSDEVVKIAKATKGKNEDLVPAKKPLIANRVALGAMGLGAIVPQAPMLSRYAAGRGMVYHGTNLPAAAGIMGSAGIDPAFAGSTARSAAGEASKSVRINRHLMADQLNRVLEQHGMPLGEEELIRNPKLFHRLMDKGLKSKGGKPMPASEAAQTISEHVLGKLIRKGKLDPAKAAKIQASLMKELPRFGQRVYAGTHPADVSVWGTGMNELDMVKKKFQEMAAAKSGTGGDIKAHFRNALELMTGGLPSTIGDIRSRMKYKPHETVSMTRAQATEELKRLAAAGGEHRAVFGVHTPTANMGYLEDFPVVRRLMEANPGFKNLLRNTLGVQTYEPGRDLSFPHLLPKEQFKHVDILDDATKKIRRINISDFQRAAASPMLQRAKRLAIPSAITALGGLAMYRAIKPKDKMVPRNHPQANLEMAGKKKLATIGSDVASVAKYVIPAAAAGGAIGIGSHKLMDKLIPRPKKDPETVEQHAKELARGTGRLMAAMSLAGFGGAALGAGAGALAKGRQGAILGGMAGLMAGQTFGSLGVGGRETASTLGGDPHFSVLPNKAQEVIAKNPWIGGAKDVAIGAALPIAGAYALRKYYPSVYARMSRGVRLAAKELL